MDRLKRNHLCIWLMVISFANIIAYAVVYAVIGGDAPNGYLKEDGGKIVYYIRGHFVHRMIGYEQDVPRWVWIYSYIHSISIWPSLATLLLAMLVMARPHIMATYQGGIMSGQTLVTVMATVIVIVTAAIMLSFIVSFVRLI